MKNIEAQKIDIKGTCEVYTRSIQQTLKDLFSVDLKNENSVVSLTQLKEQENLYFSILFTGEVYGEFLIGLTRQTALKMLNIPYDDDNQDEIFSKNRVEILETFKEVVNIAAGKAVGQFKEVFADLSITPPRSIEGHMTLSAYQITMSPLTHESGVVSCYIYIDYMRLEISKSLARASESLNIEKDKQEELKRLNRAKSEFLSNMSHELRTPLNGMIGMLDILKSSVLSQVQLEQFDIIYRSGEFLLTLISDILEFSKIESGKLEIEKIPFDLRDAIEGVADNLTTVVQHRDLDFIVHISPQIIGKYVGDQTRIKQVLINLIGNAIKFTPTGSIHLTVEPLANDMINFHVKDTGIGIPPDKLEAIFGSFSQVDVSDNRKYGGTGLGLSISKSLISAMGGEIQVASEEAQGTTFSFQIPMALVADSSKPFQVPELKDKTVWILTDSPLIFSELSLHICQLEPAATIKRTTIQGVDTIQPGDLVFSDFKSWKNYHLDLNFISKIENLSSEVILLTESKYFLQASELISKSNIRRASILSNPIFLGKLARALSVEPNKRIETDSVAKKLDTSKVGREDGLSPTKNILIVDDNEVNQLVLTTMLTKIGYKCHIANDGKQAFQLFQEGHRYDLVFMDCQMPIMNGYEATKAIRSLEKEDGRHVQIIALTADAFRETKEACFECGMDDFATKPIKFGVLEELLRKSMQK